MSKGHACDVVGQHRSTQRREALVPDDGARLFVYTRELAAKHPRFGYGCINQRQLRRG